LVLARPLLPLASALLAVSWLLSRSSKRNVQENRRTASVVDGAVLADNVALEIGR
jgi:hypothetical protein